jgi:hypothetical protein
MPLKISVGSDFEMENRIKSIALDQRFEFLFFVHQHKD